MKNEMLPGCLIFRKDVHVGLVDHYGVVLAVDPVQIAHIDKAANGNLRIKGYESLEEFAAGAECKLWPRNDAVARELMDARIREVENRPPPYGLLAIGQKWNCESFARYVADGMPASRQAEQGLLKAVLAAVVTFVGAIIVNENGTALDSNGCRSRFTA
jgi:hypothetical protein